MNKEKKTAIAIMLFGGTLSLGYLYKMYGWYGVAAILGTMLMCIYLIATAEEEENV